MPRGPSWLQGLPEQVYTRITSYAGQDLILQLTFVNSQGQSSTPTNPITYRVDSLETATNIIPLTNVTPTSNPQVLQISGALLQTTRQYLGRENFQIWITAVIPDSNVTSGSITVQQIVLLELIAIAIPPQ